MDEDAALEDRKLGFVARVPGGDSFDRGFDSAFHKIDPQGRLRALHLIELQLDLKIPLLVLLDKQPVESKFQENLGPSIDVIK